MTDHSKHDICTSPACDGDAHTPTPWAFRKAKAPIDGEFDFGIYATIDGMPKIIAEAFGRAGKDIRPDAEANAAFIVRAVNTYDVMLAALRAALAFAEHELELREPSADPDYIKYAKEAVETARVAIAAAT